jgi:hypothetical protein
METVSLTMVHCKNFVNVTMYPHYNNNMIINFFKRLSFFNLIDFLLTGKMYHIKDCTFYFYTCKSSCLFDLCQLPNFMVLLSMYESLWVFTQIFNSF